VNDLYVSDAGTAAAIDPIGPAPGTPRAVRGGAWQDSASRVRNAAREGADPTSANHRFGFRLVLGE
jgi:formylglycine-generating enzyme required for sulfatase activity